MVNAMSATTSDPKPACDHAVRYAGKITAYGDTCALCGAQVRPVHYITRDDHPMDVRVQHQPRKTHGL